MQRVRSSFRWQLIVAWLIFAIGCTAGLWSNVFHPDADPSAVSERLAGPMLPWYRIFAINAGVALQLGAGFFSAGVLSGFWLGFLGFDISSTIASLVRAGASSPMLVAAHLPHGVIEIPALVSAGAAGLGGATVALCAARGERAGARLRTRQSVNLMTAAFGLLIIAAIVEAWLTPWLLRRLL